MALRFPVMRLPRLLPLVSRKSIASSSHLPSSSPFRALTTRAVALPKKKSNLRAPLHIYCHRNLGVGSHGLGLWEFLSIQRISIPQTARFSAMALPRIQESQVVENEVSLTGVLCEEPQLDYTEDGAAYLDAVIEVKRPAAIGSDRFILVLEPLEGNPAFAERAAMEAKLGSTVWVRGRLSNQIYDEDKQLTRPEVLVRQLAMVQSDSVGLVAKDVSNMAVEEIWDMFFRDPADFWDNRFNKRNPRAPDFKHKESGASVWLDSRTNPSDVNEKLEGLLRRGVLASHP